MGCLCRDGEASTLGHSGPEDILRVFLSSTFLYGSRTSPTASRWEPRGGSYWEREATQCT